MVGQPAIPLSFPGGGLVDADLLRSEAESVGVLLEQEAAERLLLLCAMVRESPHNLTAIRDPVEMRRKHLVDSLACLPSAGIRDGELVVDLGSGGGFPGIPIGVVHPGAQVILVDAAAKKADFLRAAVERLQLANVTVVQERAEDMGRLARWREQASCVTARAVAPMRVLVELGLPLCRVGGRLVALKGIRAEQEIRDAEEALRRLGGRVAHRRAFALPDGEERRVVVRVEKTSPTPAKYPRRAGVPERQPL